MSAIVVKLQGILRGACPERAKRVEGLRMTNSVEKALLSLLGKERSVVMKLGIQVPHLHLHIYPVAATDDRAAVMAAIDGRVRHEPAEGEAEKLIQRLRHALAPHSERL